tara:strand:- start:114 stop:446 length:333 start_codon:yes stop_codon:yes gene_type:complete
MKKVKKTSIINKLRKEGKSSEQFEAMLSCLNLEELIALKLEISSTYIQGKLYGLPLWNSFQHITKDALLKFANSTCKTNLDAASLLGISNQQYKNLLKKYDIKSFFEESS